MLTGKGTLFGVSGVASGFLGAVFGGAGLVFGSMREVSGGMGRVFGGKGVWFGSMGVTLLVDWFRSRVGIGDERCASWLQPTRGRHWLEPVTFFEAGDGAS